MTTPCFETTLEAHIRSHAPLIVVVTPEEKRLLDSIMRVCNNFPRQCLTYDIAEGLRDSNRGNGGVPTARDPLSALEQVEREGSERVYVFKDFHACWGNDQVKRELRNVAQRLKHTKKTIIVTCPTASLPKELEDEAVVIAFPPPTDRELSHVVDQLLKSPGVQNDLKGPGRERLLQAARGLTSEQASHAVAMAIIVDGHLDERAIESVTREKARIVAESKALRFSPAAEMPDRVGGLDVLKKYVRLRERAFTSEAREYGLPAPKGILLIGSPGTGKSLTAKAIAGQWKLPLLRFDVGAVFGSLLGESEGNAHRATVQAEAMAPCVLWIDEMDKAFAQGAQDGGTSARVLGSTLTWMQEKTAPVFVVATANNVTQLPPELLRKGRFDEIFFLDLPTLSEREQIFEVHLRRRNRDPKEFDLGLLARISEGYVGSEIEQAVIDALYIGFDDGVRPITTQDIEAAAKLLVPISISQREVIETLRRWLREGRARSASFQEVAEAEQQSVRLDFKKRN